MGTYRTLIMGILPNYLLPVMDRIGDMADPARLKTQQMRREKVIEAALREYFERVGAEVPEIAQLLVEVRKQTMRYAKGNRRRKLAVAQRVEELRMMGRRVRDDIPMPKLKIKEIRDIVDHKNLMQARLNEEVAEGLGDDFRIKVSHIERDRLAGKYPELVSAVESESSEEPY